MVHSASSNAPFLDTLKEACQNLKSGQMVSVPELTLMDAMAAIQILDPRVDGGMEPIPTQLMAKCDQISDEGIDSTSHSCFEKYAQLTPKDLIWIMDRMLACEAAWLECASLSGASLSQTIHTCLYVHHLSSIHPNSIQTPKFVGSILRPFLIAILKSVGLIWDELAKGNLLDGEDFIGDKAGVSLLEDLDAQHSIDLLDNALRWLDHDQDAIEEQDRKSLQERLLFRKHFLSAITLISHMDPSITFQHTKDLKSSLHQSVLHISSAQSQLSTLSDGSSQLHQPDLNAAPSSRSRHAFDPWFCRHASDIKLSYTPSAIAPPQPLELNRPQDTIKVFKLILDGMEDFCRLAEDNQSWSTWKRFFDHKAITFHRIPSPPFVRSLWQSAICTDTTIALTKPFQFIAINFLLDVLGINIESIQPILWANHGILPDRINMLEQRLSRFLDRMSGQLVAHLRNLAQNRARSKRRLAHSYGDLVALANEASALGSDLADTLGSKVLHPDSLFWAVQSLALDTMLHCIFAGIELDLYRTEELLSVYWMTCQLGKEQLELWSALSSTVGLKRSSQESFFNRASIVYHSSRAWYLLLRDTSKQMGLGQHSWLTFPNDDDQIQQTMFCKRFKWLEVRSQPETCKNLTKFWIAFREDVEMTHSQDIDVEERLREAKGDLEQAILFCKTVGETDRQISAYQQELHTTLEVISFALRDGVSDGLCLIPFNFHCGSHPWFPTKKSRLTTAANMGTRTKKIERRENQQ